jgi:hypothetical protein
MCLMISGLLRGLGKFASQAAWNNPDLMWITLLGLVNWPCDILMPVYAVLQVLQNTKNKSRGRGRHAVGLPVGRLHQPLCKVTPSFLSQWFMN